MVFIMDNNLINKSWKKAICSDVVETIALETEIWLKFPDETDTSPKTPRLETCSKSRLETSKFVHFDQIF